MKHPNRDELAPFVFGETSPATTRELNNHLRECADCRAQVEAWRRTLKRLDAWKIPAGREPAFRFPPAVKWAAAAAIVLAIGFALGRFVPSSPDPKLMARLESSLREKMTAQVNEQIRVGVAAELDRGVKKSELVSAKALALLESRLDATRKAQSEQLAAEFATLMNTQRDDNREFTEALFSKLQNRYDTGYLALRKDLETVALVADEQLQDTNLKLVELAAIAKPNE